MINVSIFQKKNNLLIANDFRLHLMVHLMAWKYQLTLFVLLRHEHYVVAFVGFFFKSLQPGLMNEPLLPI